MTIGIQESISDDLIPGGSCNCRWYCCPSGTCESGCAHKPNLCGPNDDWECTGRCSHPSAH